MAKAAPPLPASAVALQSIWSAFAVQDDSGYPLWMGAWAGGARAHRRVRGGGGDSGSLALPFSTLPAPCADADAFADFVEACPDLLCDAFTFDDAMDLYDAAVAAA